MAKKKTKRSAADRYASQVDAESTLKFGPEQFSLASALQDADRQYGSDVAVAKGTRSAIQSAVKAATPAFKKQTGTALGTVNQAQSSLAADLAKLGGAGALAGASSRDAEGTKRRLAEALAANEAEMTHRSTDAVSGERFAIAAAGARKADAHDKVNARATELAREQGAFAQGRTGELVEAARQRSVTRRGQDKTEATARANRRTQNKNADAALEETKRHNQQVEKQAEKDAKEKKKPKRASAKDTEATRTQITRAISQANALKKEGKGRHEAASQLVNGRESMTIKNAPRDGKYGGVDYKAGDPLAVPIVIPGVKQTEQLIASVALDMAYDGHVSTRNMKLLQKQGLSVRDLGLNTKGRSGTSTAAPAPKSILPKVTLPSGVTALRPNVGGILPPVPVR